MNIRATAAPFGAYMCPAALFDYVGLNREAYKLTDPAMAERKQAW